MDFPVAFNTVTRSSSDDSVGKKTLKPFSNFQDISSSVDSWKEKRKLKFRSKGMLDMLKKGQSKSTEEITCEHSRYRIISSASDETSGETPGSDEQEVKPAQQKRGAFYENVLSTDKNKISSYTMCASHRSSNSDSNSSNSVSPQLTLTTLLSSSQLHLLHDGEKAEGSSGTEKGVSATRQATTDIRSSRTISTDRSGFAPQSAAESASSSFLLEANSPVSNCSLSPFSKRSVSNTSSHDGDAEASLNEGEEEILKHRLNRAERANKVVDEREALTNAEDDGVVSHLDNRNNSKAIGNSDNDYDNDGICDDDDGVERRDHQQKTIVTQNLENDEMLDVDFTAIEATQTLNNENARQKLLLRRKSSLANRQRPTRTRKRFSESDSESESNYLNAESDTYEIKKTRDIHYVDLPETDEYKCIAENSSKTLNEDSEVPLQPVLKERKDLGLQLKKEKDQENRAVLDTTPVVLRKNSYNSFENTAGSRKPLIQEVNFEGTKSEQTTPFENIRRTPRQHEFLRGTKDLQSLEDLSDKVDSPPVGSESHKQRQKNLDSRKETHRESSPGVETQPRILRAVSRIDKRIFEDGPRTRISTEDDWLAKRSSTPTTISVSQKESSSPADSNSGQKTEKWSVLRQPLDSGNDNRNTCDKQTWLKKNLDQRRTISYTFTPPSKELDTKESQEAPWIKEFRNSRKRVSLVFSNRDQVKPVLDKPSSVETTSVRISKPLSSLAGEQSSRAFVSGKVAVHTTSSSAVEKKETSTILPEGTASPKYKVERKSSFNNTNECDVSSRMKENRSPVSKNSINTAEPYLPSWSVADAGEAPASLADTRSDIPDWQRKLAEKNKLRKQSFRRIEDSSSTKANIEDGSPKAQPVWRQKLKNRTQSMVEQAEKKAPEKPDWIKQAEERSARLAKTKLLGD